MMATSIIKNGFSKRIVGIKVAFSIGINSGLARIAAGTYASSANDRSRNTFRSRTYDPQI